MITSEQEILQLVKSGGGGDLDTYYKEFQEQCTTAETYYNLNFTFEIVEGYEGYVTVPESAQVAINKAANQIDTANIRVEVRPRTTGTRADEQSERLRKFLLGAWHRVYSNQGLILHDEAKHEFLYGVGFMKVLFDLELWGDRPLISKKEDINTFNKRLEAWRESNLLYFPFVVCVVNPKTIMPDPSISGSQYYIEKYERKVLDVANRWPNWSTNKGLNDPCTWVECWTKDAVAYLCDNEVVQEFTPHHYGFIPYVKAEAGFGLQSANAKPEDKWRGLLFPLYGRIKQQARLETMIECNLASTVYAEKILQGPSEAREALEKFRDEMAAHPASVNILDIDEAKYWQMEPFQSSPDAFSLLARTSAIIDTETVAPVLGGVREPGVRAGYEVAMRAGLAKRTYTVALFNLERACEQINERFLKLVENVIKDDVTVWGRTPAESFDQTISPSDIKGYYENHVTLSSISPEEEDRRSHLGVHLFERNAISWWTLATRYLQLENPSEEFKRMMFEKLLMSPEIMQQLIPALIQTEEMQEQVEAIGAGGAIGGVGNQGNPPPPGFGAYEPQRMIRPGSPEEAELRARQMTTMGAGMYPRRPQPPQLRPQ